MLRIFVATMALCATAVFLLGAAPQQHGLRDALWFIVHDECVPDQLQHRNPDPCVQVNLQGGTEKGFAVLKGIRGASQFLLIPTAQISGIESPAILAADAPNYFDDAWEARAFIDQSLHQTMSRDDIGMAINSAASRSQDQLHIHVDCIQPTVREVLRNQDSSIANRWAPLHVSLYGHSYQAMWVPGERLEANNPFRLLAEGIPDAAQDMGDRTLVVMGSSRADGTAGFVMLEDQVNRANHDLANGEELLDHACRLAQAVPARPPTATN